MEEQQKCLTILSFCGSECITFIVFFRSGSQFNFDYFGSEFFGSEFIRSQKNTTSHVMFFQTVYGLEKCNP